MSSPCNMALLALLTALATGPAQDPQPLVRDPVRLVDGGAIVELDLDDVPLQTFLEASQRILGVPLQSEPADVANVTLTADGIQRVAVADFRDAFDALLRRYKFWTWDETTGSSTVLLVFKPNGEVRYGRSQLPFTPPVITSEELAQGPKTRSPMYTTSFQLTHVYARDMLILAMPLFNSQVETVSHIEGSNQLLVTASREHLLALRDALAQVDVPGPTPSEWDAQLAAVGKRISDLEQRLTALEDKAGG